MKHLNQHLRLMRELDSNATKYLAVTPIPPPPRVPRIHPNVSTDIAFGFVLGTIACIALHVVLAVIQAVG